MWDQIIDQLVARGVATHDQAAHARALIALGGDSKMAMICQAGIPEGEVLRTVSQVARLPCAPDSILGRPRVKELGHLDLAPFVAIRVAPFAVYQGHLCVVFPDPEIARSPGARRLPRHRAFLALPRDVELTLARVVESRQTPPASLPAPAAPGGLGASAHPGGSGSANPFAGGGVGAESGLFGAQLRAALHETGLVDAGAEPPPPPPPLPPAPLEEAATMAIAMPPVDLSLASFTPASASFENAAEPEDSAATIVTAPLSMDTPPRGAPPREEAPVAATVVVSPVSGWGAPAHTPARPAPAPASTVPDFAPPSLGPPGAPAAAAPAAAKPSSIVLTPAPAAAPPAAPVSAAPAATAPGAPPAAPPSVTAPSAAAPSAAGPSATPAAMPAAGGAPSLQSARESMAQGIERYKTLRVLGRGGMATVYLAEDTQTGQQVALKIMEPNLAEDDTFIERFRRELKTSASLHHENVVQVVDSAEQGGNLYMVAEFVDAGTLKELKAAMGGSVPGPIVAEILYQCLLGLGHAHDMRLVHRDLKPANLMLTSTGIVKVGDFGIAKSSNDNTITQTGMLFGTPAYMSPEQAYGRELDGRSDLFSMGTVCYELLLGYNPYHHENVSTCLIRISQASARHIFEVVPTVPRLLEEVLTQLMRQDRGDRFSTAHDAVRVLEPLVKLLRERFGNLVERALADPEGTKQFLATEEASLELQRVESLLTENPDANLKQAAFRLYRAHALDPANEQIAARFQQMAAAYAFRFDTNPTSEGLDELVAALEQKPGSPALLRRGADVCLARKNLLGAAAWLKRYLIAQPGDLHMRRKLGEIVGEDPLSPWQPVKDPHITPTTQDTVVLPDVEDIQFDDAGGDLSSMVLASVNQQSGRNVPAPMAEPPVVAEASAPSGSLVDPAGVAEARAQVERARRWAMSHQKELRVAGIGLVVILGFLMILRTLFSFVGQSAERKAQQRRNAPTPVSAPAGEGGDVTDEGD